MKNKFVIFILILLLAVTGCQSNTEKKKEKYNAAIIKVISLEKERVSKDVIIERKKTGIVVYGTGDYISLFYDLKPEVREESIYRLNQQKEYEYIPKENREKFLTEDEEVFMDDDYIENLGRK